MRVRTFLGLGALTVLATACGTPTMMTSNDASNDARCDGSRCGSDATSPNDATEVGGDVIGDDAFDATDVPPADVTGPRDGAVDAATDVGVPTSTGLGLDESGTTIPDTNLTPPAGAIFIAPNGNDTNAGSETAPVLTINRAVSLVPAGGTIVARAGTYRDWFNNGTGGLRINTKPFTLQAYPHEQAWFDGSDPIPSARWQSDGAGHWYIDWATTSFCDGHYYDHAPNAQAADNSGPCTHRDMYDAAHPVAGDGQNAFFDGARLAQTGTLASVDAASFYYDFTARRLYLGRDPGGHVVELSARPVFMVSGVSTMGMHIRGVGFRRFATNEYSNTTSGALYFGGSSGHNVVEECAFTQMSAQALSFSNPSDGLVRHSVFAQNGFNAAGGNGHSASGMRDDLVVEDSLFNAQNLEHYGTSCSLSCASAHLKFAHLVGWTVRHNVFENGDSETTGVWCDTDCHDGITVDNLITGPISARGVGIHYEINFGGIIASNVIVGFSSAINIGAQDVRVWNNTMIDQNTIALRAYDDNRAQATTNLSFFNNVAWGTNVNKVWFANGGGTNGPGTFVTGFDFNAWYRPTNFVLYRWIDGTDTHFNSSTAFHTAHTMFEANAVDEVGASDPFFVNRATGDYHIRAGSSAYHNGTAIPADIATAMGASPAAGQSRGAISWATN